MKHLIFFLVSFFFYSAIGFGFVPPLAFVLKANFEGRKGLPVETVFRHQIILRTGETLSVEERLAEIGGKIYLIFKSPNYGEVGCAWSKGIYVFPNEKKLTGRSRVFNYFFTMNKSDSFRELLINEQFLKRDFFTQYKTSFVPQGDPATWDLKENYVIQSEVNFSRTPAGPAITAIGFEQSGVKKSVSFEKESLVLTRLEWKEGSQITSWNFQGFKKLPGDGWFPLELFLSVDNKDMVTSSLISRQYLKEQTSKQWLTKFTAVSKSALNSSFEEGLRVLLEYR